MNKMISFRDLIDLEPKPKKIKYEGEIFKFDRGYYQSMSSALEDLLNMNDMKEQNIEIIEEDKPLIEDELPEIFNLCETSYDPQVRKAINQIINYIKSKEKGE